MGPKVKSKVALIGTGGTISSVGKGPFDIIDYSANGKLLDAAAMIDRFPEVRELADLVPVPFQAVLSSSIHFPTWQNLLRLCDSLVAEHRDLAGIVILHGTASLEETAYFLHLTLKVDVPVVMVGAQRPASALSTDAGMNLANAIRTAASPAARGLGVLAVLNDEIQSAREVTKTSTYRLHTFRSPDFGVLGHADGDEIAFYRRPLRRHAPDAQFDARKLDALPRVDIAYTYAGADGTAVRAFVEAGARGIVCAGFAPGLLTPGDEAALADAVKKGVVVVVSTRVGSGRTVRSAKLRKHGFLAADNLNPQKARILLALALTVTRDTQEIERIFQIY
jgi:L-asparaginase